MSHGILMIGLQVIMMVCTSIVIYKWLTAPKDRYDEMLERLMEEEECK